MLGNFDLSRLFSGPSAGSGGGEWNTVVKPEGSALTYGTDGSIAGISPGAFGSALEGIGGVVGGSSSSGGSAGSSSGAFAAQAPQMDDGSAAQAQLRANIQNQQQIEELKRQARAQSDWTRSGGVFR